MQERPFSMTLSILKNTILYIVRCYPRQQLLKNDRPMQRWWKCFKSRHQEVVLRIREGLKLKRCIGLNKIVCGQFLKDTKLLVYGTWTKFGGLRGIFPVDPTTMNNYQDPVFELKNEKGKIIWQLSKFPRRFK